MATNTECTSQRAFLAPEQPGTETACLRRYNNRKRFYFYRGQGHETKARSPQGSFARRPGGKSGVPRRIFPSPLRRIRSVFWVGARKKPCRAGGGLIRRDMTGSKRQSLTELTRFESICVRAAVRFRLRLVSRAKSAGC